jgi:protein involved in polysaccharide export with SLBB domain
MMQIIRLILLGRTCFLRKAVTAIVLLADFSQNALASFCPADRTQVYVLGAVKTPGLCVVDRPKSPGLLVEQAIELCGGITPNADVHNIQVRQLDEDYSFSVDLSKPIGPRGSLAKHLLMTGEVVFVPGAISEQAAWTALIRTGQVSIMGAVAFPGFVDFDKEETPNSLIVKAGGLCNRFAMEGVFVGRIDHGQLRKLDIISLEGDGADRKLDLQAGDIVYFRGMEPLGGPVDIGPRY